MPTYQYTCTDCGEHLEVVQKFADEPLTVCPTCEGRLRKVFSAVGVVFKGSGFYRTDSRSSAASSSSSSSGGGKSTDGAAKESTAANKTESKSDSASSGSSSGQTSATSKKSGEKVA